MRIVGIGGGTGLPVLLNGLKQLKEQEALDIAAIVNVSDSGGSSGYLRNVLGMPAMGDIRNCLLALASGDPLLKLLCGHRFRHAEELTGHSIGNLVLSGLYQMSGDFVRAVKEASDILGLEGRVLPSTDAQVTLCAEYSDGTSTRGESNIPRPGQRIRRVWLDPQNVRPAPDVLDVLYEADAIVLGPGSLYTSIIPNLLVSGIPEAIRRSRAIKVYVCNLMTQRGETDGYSASDHLRALLCYLPRGSIDACVYNTVIGTAVAQRYFKSGSHVVPGSADEIRGMGVVPAAAPLFKKGQIKARHDSELLARLVVRLARGHARDRETVCGSERKTA
jgi:uncharacterized cofD-like protein